MGIPSRNAPARPSAGKSDTKTPGGLGIAYISPYSLMAHASSRQLSQGTVWLDIRQNWKADSGVRPENQNQLSDPLSGDRYTYPKAGHDRRPSNCSK